MNITMLQTLSGQVKELESERDALLARFEAGDITEDFHTEKQEELGVELAVLAGKLVEALGDLPPVQRDLETLAAAVKHVDGRYAEPDCDGGLSYHRDLGVAVSGTLQVVLAGFGFIPTKGVLVNAQENLVEPAPAGKRMQAFAPTGRPIVGSVETLKGTAQLNGLFKNDQGHLDPGYLGETDVDWDSQENLEGQYKDDSDAVWNLVDLVWREVDEYGEEV